MHRERERERERMGVMVWVEAILMRLVFGGCWVGALLGFRV